MNREAVGNEFGSRQRRVHLRAELPGEFAQELSGLRGERDFTGRYEGHVSPPQTIRLSHVVEAAVGPSRLMRIPPRRDRTPYRDRDQQNARPIGRGRTRR